MADRNVIYDSGNSLSTIEAFLKEDYVENNIRSLVNTSTEFLGRIKTKPTDFGLGWVESIKTTTAQGSGARAEYGTLPQAGFSRTKKITGEVKHLYGKFRISSQSIKATRNNKAAFKSALTEALDGTKEGFRLDLQRQAWGDGSAILGRVATTAAASVTIAVSDPYGLTYVQADLEPWEKVLTFREDMRIWIYTTGGAGTNAFRTITGVDLDAGTITVDAAVAVTAGDLIYLGDSATSNNVDNEITGISGFVKKTGSYFGLPRAGQRVLQSAVKTSSGNPANLEAEMRSMSSELFRNSTEQGGMIILANTNVFDTYTAQLTTERRQVNPTTLKSGQRAVEYEDKVFVKDKDCPPQRQYWLRMEDIFWRQLGTEGWVSENGNTLHRSVSGGAYIDAWEADWSKSANLVTRAPANHGLIEGIERT